MHEVCFVNQEAAYELRICDWSADVCSSDLSGGAGAGDANDRALISGIEQAAAGARIMGAARSEQRDAAGDRFRRGILADRDHVHARLENGLAAFEAAPLHIEIGRAACRARVGKYV